jgi:hypothetical protein
MQNGPRRPNPARQQRPQGSFNRPQQRWTPNNSGAGKALSETTNVTWSLPAPRR